MANFIISDRADGFEGAFEVQPAADHQPSEVEKEYLKKLGETLGTLAADASEDKTATSLPAGLLGGRKTARASVVSRLRSDAEKLAAGNLPAETATANIATARSEYLAELEKLKGQFPTKPKFTTIDRPDRFDGCFQIDFLDDYQPNEAEKEYLKKVSNALSQLESDEIRNKEEQYRRAPEFLDLNRAARRKAAGQLRLDVENVGTQDITIDTATAQLEVTQARYGADLNRINGPRFEIEERSDIRFEGDFQIKPADHYRPNPAEAAYIDRVRFVLNKLADDAAADAGSKEPAAVIGEQKKARQALAADLRRIADIVSKGLREPDLAGNNALMWLGGYVRDSELMSGRLFTVSAKPETTLATDLEIEVATNLLPPNNVVPPEKHDLYTAIKGTQTVVSTVCERLRDGDDETICASLFGKKRSGAAADRAGLLLDEYLRKLAVIGRLGLEGPHTALAKAALESLRAEFVAHEGPRIKNSYVCRLGFAAAIAAAIFLSVYTLIAIGSITWPFWVAHKPFLLAGVGAAIGTWLSFSIRQVELSFNHLGVIEDDLLDPAFRILFVVALTITACLLFWTGVMNIEIGSLKTSSDGFAKAGTIPLLIGLFCGISERALATSISGRAATFVRGISG